MVTTEHLSFYNKNGYVILEDAIPPEKLSSVQQAYEDVISHALDRGHAERDGATGFMKQHRFQNPHHPDLARRELMEAFSAAPLMAFCHDLVGSRLAFFGVAAFTMQANYDYRGSWHRDSYAAWGKDSEKERSVREHRVWPCTQVLLALQADACFWMVPGSHNRPNTVEEEARFEDDRTSWEETFPDAVQLKLKAGSAAPFDSRAIHRGLKRPGSVRRSLFLVFGTPAEARDSAITGWAQDPVYRNPDYLASLPADLRLAVKMTCAVVADSS